MFSIMSADDAVAFIKDGDVIGINSFLALANPNALHTALAKRFKATGHPRELELFCESGFGGWDESLFADQYVSAGAVRKIVASHFMSTPSVMRMARENQIECYCMPLGVLSHALRAAAGGSRVLLSKVGLNIFVDPRLDGPGLNAISKEQRVHVVSGEGKDYLLYDTPRIDIAFIKGTSADPSGNITFENEFVTADALSMAQTTKSNGGKVLVQVEKLSHVYARPRSVIIPGALVDAIVVCDELPPLQQYNPVLSGDIHVPPAHMDYWLEKLSVLDKLDKRGEDMSADIIGKRAARELKKGDIVNIGIGIPEKVGQYASEAGVLRDLTLTVEAGGFGGLPAPGVSFGATIGSDMVCDVAAQFDFYDGGGLDVCFMGALEVDMLGNVNAHKLSERYAGIGGFANITGATKNIVFCLMFSAKGLCVKTDNTGVHIEKEGSLLKFRREINAISFSAKNAIANGQNVIYVTERCVFKLTPNGLKLMEVYDGVDKQSQIIDMLDFELAQ
jgi:propionate CoA-transferase